jgi:N-acetylmuramoyl-L-alanine amidase
MLQPIIAYLVKVIICSGLLLMYYMISLRNRRFHYYNRFYLLLSVGLSAVLPLLRLEWFTAGNTVTQAINVFRIIDTANSEEFSYANSASVGWQQIALCGLLVISLVQLALLGDRIMKIYRLKKMYSVNKTIEFDFISTDLPQAPFSFLKNIFWRSDISLQEKTGRQILRHEIIHVRQKHSWDKLFIQSILCFFWMNPFYWILKKELYIIHEFIADEKAVENYDAAAFAEMLLTAQYGKFDFFPAHAFFYSSIKRRLIMLTTSRKSQFSYLRRLMVLPLLAVVICLFAFTVQKETGNNIVKAATPFKLVVDAGHGGKDFGVAANGLYEKNITLKIAEKIKLLSTEYGIEVILTRSSDLYMSPLEKSDFANAQRADALISVHVNAAEKSQLQQSGFEVVLSAKNAQEFSSVLLGSAILQSLQPNFKVLQSLQNRTVGIWILDKSILPAALIECGYLTDMSDADLLRDDAGIELIARQILSGAALYANNRNSVSAQNIIHADSDTIVPAQSDSSLPAQTPLYVLDGKIVTKEKADEVDPSCIEQVIVLKGSDATDKYGDKGKNGVVEIVIKKDKNGEANIIIKNKTGSKIKKPVPPPPPPPQ